MDAWHSQRKQDNSGRAKARGKIDYSKFDKIVDSDDEQEEASAAQQVQSKLPPAVGRALAEIQLAEQSGNIAAAERAARALEANIDQAPPEFKDAMDKVRRDRGGAAPTRGTAPASGALGAALEQQQTLEQQQRQLDELMADPEKMIRMMLAAGITEDQLSTPAGKQAAMARLSAYMAKDFPVMGLVDPSSAPGATTTPHPPEATTGVKAGGSMDPALLETATKLAEQRAEVERARAECQEQQAAIDKAQAEVTRAATALASAEKEKAEAGLKVDASVDAARADMVAQAEKEKEMHETRRKVVEDLKERGNQAMARRDYGAARTFYSEAIEVPEVPNDVRAALYGNRTACLLAMGEPAVSLRMQEDCLALDDAERALELVPGWIKGHYRLSAVHEALGNMEGAVAAMQAALELDPESDEIAGKLARLQAAAAAAATEEEAAAAAATKEAATEEAATEEATEAAVAEEVAEEGEEADDYARACAPSAEEPMACDGEEGSEDEAGGVLTAEEWASQKVEADNCFRGGAVEDALTGYSRLLTHRGGASPSELLSALSCRSACYLKQNHLGGVEEDIHDALEGALRPHVPDRLHLKLLLRRAEARMRAGRLDGAASDLLDAETYAKSDEERRALSGAKAALDESNQSVV